MVFWKWPIDSRHSVALNKALHYYFIFRTSWKSWKKFFRYALHFYWLFRWQISSECQQWQRVCVCPCVCVCVNLVLQKSFNFNTNVKEVQTLTTASAVSVRSPNDDVMLEMTPPNPSMRKWLLIMLRKKKKERNINQQKNVTTQIFWKSQKVIIFPCCIRQF